MKIISNFLQSIEGIQIWFIISLLIFFLMFLVFLYRIFRKPKEEMNRIKNSILDDENETDHINIKNSEV
jgi:cbb3-type cytochrome oxidase subunit 3